MSEKFDEDFDRTALTSEFEMWRETGIPWAEFQEKEIHALLKMHFESLGYEVRWRHKNDPSHEKGVDLECIKDSERILIGVKRKAKQKDISQLVQLSKHEADRKIFVYIEGATQSFLDIADDEPEVELWTTKDLEKNFKRSDLIFALHVDNSPFRKSIRAVRFLISDLNDSDLKSEKISESEIKELFPFVWSMKDRAVTLHKGSRLLQLIFERGDRIKSLNYDDLLFLCKRALDFFYRRSLVAIQNILSKNREKFEKIWKELHEKTSSGSSWLYIFGMPFSSLTPGSVIEELGQFEENRESAEKLEKIKEMVDEEKTTNFYPESPERFQITADLFRKISGFAWGLETAIDNLHGLLLSKL